MVAPHQLGVRSLARREVVAAMQHAGGAGVGGAHRRAMLADERPEDPLAFPEEPLLPGEASELDGGGREDRRGRGVTRREGIRESS